MDMAMPVMNGLYATRQILETKPTTKVLILSAYNDEIYIQEAMNAGAMGYLLKQTAGYYVCQAVRGVHRGRNYFGPSVVKRFVQLIPKKKPKPAQTKIRTLVVR
jgi:DNA-binding NarL/FixJ family response regulator